MRSTRVAALAFPLALSLAVSLIAFAGGCTRTPGGIAPSNIPLEQGGYTVLSHVGASDCKVNLLGIIPVSGANYTEDAIKKALAKAGGDALINITVERVSAYYILWSSTCTEVRGVAVSLK